MDKSHLRPNVCAVITPGANIKKVYAFKRVDFDAWQLPQGGIDEFETPREALFREVNEEIGTKKISIIKERTSPIPYFFPEEIFQKLKKEFHSEFKGQLQYYFLCHFQAGALEEINFGATPEFKAMKLMCPMEFIKSTIAFKKEAYQIALIDFNLL
ncbi:NUDIX domain-containing protein [Candidatus Riflebacteria bacterium]